MGERKDTPDSELSKKNSGIDWDHNQWELPSDLSVVSEAVENFVEKLRQRNWTQDSIDKAELVIHELLINLVKYGNKGDAQKKVFVELKELDEKKAVVSLRDQSGIFFEPTDQEEKTLSPEGLLAEGGRGIFLARGYSDSLAYGRWPENPDEEVQGTEVTFQVSNQE